MNKDIRDLLNCESLPAIVYVYDLFERRTIYQNRHLARELGYSPQESLQMGENVLGHLLHPEEMQQLPNLLRRWDHVGEGEIIETEHRLLHKNGQWRWFLARDIVYKRNNSGVVQQILGTSFDITQRKLLEDRLRHAQKLEAVGQLAGGIAHDFNNLLTSILGNVGLALSSSKGDGMGASDLEECLREIELASHHASALTQQLLSFASKQVLRKETIDTNFAIIESTRLIRSMLGESISLQLVLSPDTPHIVFDPAQFTQLILNLAINARDAMTEGGTLTIQTSAEPNMSTGTYSHPSESVSTESKSESSELKSTDSLSKKSNSDDFSQANILISDTGTGIDEAIRDRIFEPFFTTKTHGKGTGLGLATVYGIVTQSSGTIEVESTSDQGTSFLLRFPGFSASSSNKTRPLGQGISSWQGLRVLIIEDSVQVATVLAAMLEREGFSVTIANDGPVALELVHDSNLRFDLVIADIVLPHLSGPIVVKQLRGQRPNLPVLFLSGYAPKEHNVVLEGEKSDFLSKPIDAAQLRASLAKLL